MAKKLTIKTGGNLAVLCQNIVAEVNEIFEREFGQGRWTENDGNIVEVFPVFNLESSAVEIRFDFRAIRFGQEYISNSEEIVVIENPVELPETITFVLSAY